MRTPWPNVKHLRVFDYRAYVQIPKDEKSKLDDKSKPCMFLGYGHEEFDCTFYNTTNKNFFFEIQTLQDQEPSEMLDSPLIL